MVRSKEDYVNFIIYGSLFPRTYMLSIRTLFSSIKRNLKIISIHLIHEHSWEKQTEFQWKYLFMAPDFQWLPLGSDKLACIRCVFQVIYVIQFDVRLRTIELMALWTFHIFCSYFIMCYRDAYALRVVISSQYSCGNKSV